MSPHVPLITALTTLYQLLVDLGHVPALALVLPLPTESGQRRHPAYSINRAAAVENGFSDDVIELAYQIPYLPDNDDLELYFGTTSLCYLREDVVPIIDTDEEEDGEQNQPAPPPPQNLEDIDDPEGEGAYAWQYAHDPTCQGENDFWAGTKVLVLTHGHVYGSELIYDLDQQTIRIWHKMDGLDWQDVPAYPMTSLENPLYVWIRDLLSLQNIPFESGFVPPPSTRENEPPPPGADPLHVRAWRDRTTHFKRQRETKDLYISHGWKAGSFAEAQKSLSVWERLEQARERAAENFDTDTFKKVKREWEKLLYDDPHNPLWANSEIVASNIKKDSESLRANAAHREL